MRSIRYKIPDNDPTTESFIYWALVLDEMLFDLTDDSQKAPALNTFSRTLELQTTASAIIQAGISKDSMTPFIDELRWSITSDPCLTPKQKELSRLHVDAIASRNINLEGIPSSVSALRIIFGDYFKAIKNKTIDIIKNTPKEKQLLHDLAASFIVQAELSGYPRRHIYYTVQKIFMQKLFRTKPIDPISLMDEFFAVFNASEANFKCLMFVDPIIKNHAALSKQFGFEIIDDIPDWEMLTQAQRINIEKRKAVRTMLLSAELPATSPARAHQACMDLFREFVSILNFFEHTQNIDCDALSVVKNETNGATVLIRPQIDPMHCWTSERPPSSDQITALTDVLHGEYFTPGSSDRLRRAIHFHRSALTSGSPENQLVGLWAALEGLVYFAKFGGNRLQHLSENILPALTLSYPEKRFSSIYNDTLKTIKHLPNLLETIQLPHSDFSKFVLLLTCSDFKQQRNELICQSKFNPLLLNNLWKTAKAFDTPKHVVETLKSHREKLNWHLARIYFTRNSIMHSARAMPHLRTLVEHLHLYVDILIKCIIRVAINSPEQLTI